MNKTELVSAMADKAGLTKVDAEKALNAFVNVVTEQMKARERVQLVGFGTFETGVREAREGKNPLTGEKIQIAKSIVPKFKAGKALKDSINA